MQIAIATEPPRQPELIELLRLSDEFALSLYPAESCYMLDVGQLEADGVTVFVARAGADAVGIAALVDRGDGSGEIKRMFVHGSARGRGIARALLAAIDRTALARGIRTLQLETGPEHVAAIALYLASGFAVIPNFGQYVGDEFSICMEKALP
ncbi:putative acetyltransferase [Marisediminicola sp. UYEF4]|uniref:GNAT family N-acetyltransferase n=1 Tax=Marisediminicola sp. UYEF4 TaxID=1756384 RepID=UPI00339812FF